jgi:hypothetical protein
MEYYINKKALGYFAKDPESQNAFFPHAELRQYGPYESVSGCCLQEGKVNQWIVKLVIGTTFELSLVHFAISPPGSLRANGAAEQVVTKESIGG